MKCSAIHVIWSIKSGLTSLHIPNTPFHLNRTNISIKKYRSLKHPFSKQYKVRVLYHGKIIQNPVWNDELIFKIVMAGQRMHKTLRTHTMIEGIRICFKYIN